MYGESVPPEPLPPVDPIPLTDRRFKNHSILQFIYSPSLQLQPRLYNTQAASGGNTWAVGDSTNLLLRVCHKPRAEPTHTLLPLATGSSLSELVLGLMCVNIHSSEGGKVCCCFTGIGDGWVSY